MTSIAVFVDAGYLFGEGSRALTGQLASRSQTRIKIQIAIDTLKAFAQSKAADRRILRIYWYDGSASGSLSSDHSTLANSDDVKLRLGQINSSGQQKGVDSLIITDLIELARNRAIEDAVLLAGDEDLRVGVQIAQNFGVRVHLLGIKSHQNSQSAQLMQECDTTTLWTQVELANFLHVTVATSSGTAAAPSQPLPPLQPLNTAELEASAYNFAAQLGDPELVDLANFRKLNGSGIPSEIDGRLLATTRSVLKRDLDQQEKKKLRVAFIGAAKQRRPDLF